MLKKILLMLSLATLSAHTQDKNQAFLRAIINNDSQMVCDLIKNNDIDVNFSNGKPLETALLFNKDKNYTIIVLLLIYGANPNIEYLGKTPLHVACLRGEHDLVELLLQWGADPNKTVHGEAPFHIACRQGKLKAVKKLRINGINVHTETEKTKLTGLHCACVSGQLKIIRELLSYDLDINAKDSQGQTPLHKACAQKYLDVVIYLIQAGADVNAQDRYGNTPLQIAKNGNNNIIVKYLQDHI